MKRILLLCNIIAVLVIAMLMLTTTVEARTCGIPIIGCCGGEGDIACIIGGCDDGLQLNAELIPKCTEYCGDDGEIACFGWVCDQGNTIDPGSAFLNYCIDCGGEDQWMCVNLVTGDIPCDYPWLRPEMVNVLPPLFKCRLQFHADEPDSGSDVVVEEQAPRGPVYGIADTHSHQFANMAFGGALLWGKPFDKRGINAALAPGDFTWDFPTVGFHDPFPIPVPFLGHEIHEFDLGASILRAATKGGGFFHGSFAGADSFAEWPKWNTTLHQQMYYRWLERAYKGGLRLMVMLGVNNEVICGLPLIRKRVVGGTLLNPEVNCDDMYTVDEQLEEVKEMERFIDRENDGMEDGDGWYRIVRSPHEARKAIREGKMAVVLGIEVDGLFGCERPGDCEPARISSELNRYFDMGVRHLFPIHLYNNEFGGSAIYNELWPYVSPLATGMLMPVMDCEIVKQLFLEGPLMWETAVYEFKVSGMEEIVSFLEAIGLNIPIFDETTTGHCNYYGLTDDGEYAVNAMMDKKMIIDADHMSLPVLDEVLGIAIERDYPLISGHSFLHERPLTEEGKASPPSEGHRTSWQIEIIRDLGGIVAPLNPRMSGSTTRDYVHMYRYIVDKMKKGDDDRYPGIAFATDWGAMFLQTAPRCLNAEDCNVVSSPDCKPYDSNNCVDSTDPDCKIFNKNEYPIAGCEGKDFPRLDYGWDWNGDGVEDGFEAVGVEGRFWKQRTGSRVFDFNKDGLAHVGLLPDFIKDLTNVGLTEDDLEPLFHSAEAYIRMWEKIHGGPPKITPVIYGIEGDNGWYVSDVTVEWEIESEAPILEMDGCDEITIDYDTDGVLLTCFAASDGGETEASVLIKRDTVPPEAACLAEPAELWPPNRKMVPVTVDTSCTDALSGPADMLVTTATSSEPDTGSGKGDRPNDMEGFTLDSSATSGELRSERMGRGPGRQYTLGYTCFDMAGNSSNCVTFVTVPHDQGTTHQVKQGTASEITLGAIDTYDDPLAVSMVIPPGNSALSISGNIVAYTSDPSYTGADNFTRKANDGQEDFNAATASLKAQAFTEDGDGGGGGCFLMSLMP